MSNTNTLHQPVMLETALVQLQVKPGLWYIDATLGYAGHTKVIIESGASVIGFDWDKTAVEYVTKTHQDWIDQGRLIIFNEAYEIVWVHQIFRESEADRHHQCQLQCVVDGSEKFGTAVTKHPVLADFLDDPDDEIGDERREHDGCHARCSAENASGDECFGRHAEIEGNDLEEKEIQFDAPLR